MSEQNRQQNRRGFLAAAGAGAVAGVPGLLLGAWGEDVAPVPMKPQPQMPAFHPEKVSPAVLSVASPVLVHAGNALYSGLSTMSDLRDAALMHQVLMAHLHEVGFDQAAQSYLAAHAEGMGSPADPDLVHALYLKVQAAGSIVSEYDFAAWLDASRAKAKMVVPAIQKYGLKELHRRVIAAMLKAAQIEPIVLRRSPGSAAVYARQVRTIGYDCEAVDWGGAYMGGMSLPMMEMFLGAGMAMPGLGEALAVGALVLWGIGKLLLGC